MLASDYQKLFGYGYGQGQVHATIDPFKTLPNEFIAMSMGMITTAAEGLKAALGPHSAAAMLYALADAYAVQASNQTGIEEPKRKK